ncbi:MAG TPA: type 1 glutamine amidotransferase [Burkholderiales bacterium]|nr:type 1 glutamine amidotransferase [Burkholderiales bacterium]
MKPVVIFRHVRSEGPGYFATVLERRSIPHRMIAVDAGEPLPRSVRAFAGLVFMGGPMSANDDLPWIAAALALMQDAVRQDVPLLGHCLGAQLMAKALGAEVRGNAVKEIGWGEVSVSDNALAREWFGERTGFTAFHWHGETFTLPRGATRMLENVHCANQAFVLGRHVGLQCHVEMTPELVRRWCRAGREDLEASVASPAVQSAEAMQHDLELRCTLLNAVAERIYARWLEGLARD